MIPRDRENKFTQIGMMDQNQHHSFLYSILLLVGNPPDPDPDHLPSWLTQLPQKDRRVFQFSTGSYFKGSHLTIPGTGTACAVHQGVC